MNDIHASLIAMAASFVLVYVILYFTKPSWVMHTKNGKTELRQDKLLLWSSLAAMFTALCVAIFYPDHKREGASTASSRSYGMGSCGYSMKTCGYGMKSCGYGMKTPYRFARTADNAMLL
jgi:hypothetical protein